MSIVLNDNLKIEAPKLIDARFGPHANLGAALAFITPALREMGLIFFVKDGSNLLEYWWPTTDLSDSGIALRSYQPLDADLTAIANIIDGGTGFLKKTAPNTWSLDTTVVTASTAAGGELEGYYPNPTLKNTSVINKVLAGFNTVGGGTIVDGDSILVAFGKVQNQLNALYGGMQFIDFWDASTNTPTILTAALGNKGNYYIVQVAGSTNIGGITDWRVGDWVVSNGSVWSKIDNTDAVVSVNGETGIVTLTTSHIEEGTRLYYTDLRVKTYADTLYSVLGHTHTFASLTSKPTTISGYGITDAYIKSEIDNFFGGIVGISGYNKTNWDAAFGWGNHAVAGYVKGTGVAQRVPYFSSTDTVTTSSRFIWDTAVNALKVNVGIAGTIGATLSGAFDGGSLQVWNGHELAVMGSTVGNSGDIATMVMKSNKGNSTANGYIDIQGYYAGGTTNTPIIFQKLGGVIIIGNIAAGADATSLLQVNGPIRQTSVTSALLKASATGVLQAAVAGTDYLTSTDLSNYYTQTQIQNFFSGASAMTGYNRANWDTAYGWGDHATAGYFLASNFNSSFDTRLGTKTTDNLAEGTTNLYYTNARARASLSAAGTGLTYNSSTGVFTWTNPGYITGYTETDPIYTASSWYSTTNNSSNWNTAYGWGNHAGLYSLLGHTHTFSSLTSKPTTLAGYGITDAATSAQGTKADTAYSWGDHSLVGYFLASNFNSSFDTRLALKSTTDLAEGINLYYTQGRFDSAFALKSTTNLAEGTNLYYTGARFNTAFAAKSTSDLSEGTNLYYTDARVLAYGDTQWVQLDGLYSNPTWITTLDWSKITSTPTTLAGYGITDGVRSVSGTAGKIFSSGGINPILTIDAAYIGQSSISNVGTITIGTWKGAAIADTYISSASNWNAAYSWGNHALAGYLTTISGIAAGGELAGTYANPTLVNSAVTGKLLSGVNITGGTILATDSILTAFGKVQNQINSLAGGMQFVDFWNATTNSPTIPTAVGNKGKYYIVQTAGTTSIDGITDWQIGDWVVSNGTTWGKIDNTDAVVSVNGFTGAVSLTTTHITEGTNLYFTDGRAKGALSFVAGTGSYNSTTGVITIPTDNNQIANSAAYITAAAQYYIGTTHNALNRASGAQTLTGVSIDGTAQYANYWGGFAANFNVVATGFDYVPVRESGVGIMKLASSFIFANWLSGSTMNIVGNATYATNSSKLYSTDPTYAYGSGAPYYANLSYNGSLNHWEFKMNPATPADIWVSRSGTATNVAASGVTGGAALSLTDDTNVTISQTGSTTALLAAKGLVMGWTGTLADSRITSAATWHAKQAAYTNLTSIGALANADGFLRQNGAGVFSYDTNTYYLASNPSGYISGNQTITLSGHVTGSGATSISTTIANGVVTTAMMASANISQWTNDSGYITGYTETDNLGSVTNRGNTTSQAIIFSNGRKGLVGVYDPQQTQAIFAMGSSYILTDGGASNVYGNLYGLAWSYNPDYGGAGNNPQSKAGLNHQLLLMQAGVTTIALGSGLWTSGAITTTSTISASNFSGTHSGSSSGTNTGDQDLSGLALRGLSNVNGVLSSTYGGAGTVSGILKANGLGTVSAAVNNSDFTLLNGTGFVRMSGTTPSYLTGASSQFVKADGSLDGNTYATTSALSGYLPLTAGSSNTITGALYINSSLISSNATYLDIYNNTVDGSDTKITRIGGGGDVTTTRGAFIDLRGNEATGGGNIYLNAGGSGTIIANAAISGTSADFANIVKGFSYSAKGIAGGWDRYFGFDGSSGTYRGGFGAFGADNALEYYYIGSAFNSNIARFNFSTLATTLYGTLSGTSLSMSGDITANSRVILTTSVAPTAQGQLGYSSAAGSYWWGKAGSINDFTLYNSGGTPTIQIPTGTTNVTLSGALSGTSLSMSGAGSFGGALDLGFNNNLRLGTSPYYYKINRSGAGQLFTYFDDEYDASNTMVQFRMRTAGTPLNALTIFGTANIGIKTAVDNGTDALQVAGSGLFSGKLNINVAFSDIAGTFALAMLGDYAGLRTGTDGSFNVDVYKYGTGYINPFKIASTGAITASSTANSDWGLSVLNSGTTGANGLYVNIGSGATGVPFRVDKNGSSLFTVANSGAITASSSVTATSLIKSGGTSTQSLIADGSVLGISNSAGANTLVQRDASGYIFNNYFYTSSGGAERNTSGLGYFAGFNSSDYYIRSYTPTAARLAMGLGTGDNVVFNQVTATLIGISSGVVVNYNNDSASTYQMLWGSGNYVYGTAGIYCNPSTDWIYAARFSETSDRTLKEVITENILVPGIENITPHLYKKKGAIELGYFAQDVQPYLPHAVTVGNNGKLTLTYRDVFAAKIYSVETRTEKLERRVRELEAELTKLKMQ